MSTNDPTMLLDEDEILVYYRLSNQDSFTNEQTSKLRGKKKGDDASEYQTQHCFKPNPREMQFLPETRQSR